MLWLHRSAQSNFAALVQPTHRLICAQVEGPNGTVQLESPIAGVVAARNETMIENPGLLARNAECVDDAWLVELDVDDDAELVRAELAALEDFPERPPK